MILWNVSHQHFVTDHVEYTTTLVEALSEGDAIAIFNEFLEKHPKRLKYPYMWSKASSAAKVAPMRRVGKIVKEGKL